MAERPLVVLLGDPGTGKSSVARRLAEASPGPTVFLDTAGLQEALLARTRSGAWSSVMLGAGTLVFDGEGYVARRPGVDRFLRELIRARVADGRRTIVCECTRDGWLDRLIAEAPCGSLVTIGLRFPASRSGRMRFARRVCDQLGLSRSAARGTDALEPWGYDAVTAALRQRASASLAPVAAEGLVAQR